MGLYCVGRHIVIVESDSLRPRGHLKDQGYADQGVVTAAQHSDGVQDAHGQYQVCVYQVINLLHNSSL